MLKLKDFQHKTSKKSGTIWKRLKLRIIRIEKVEKKTVQRPRDIFIKIIERKFKPKGDAYKDTGNMQNIT